MEHAQYLYYINKEYKPHLRKHALSMLLSSLSTKTPWFWRFRKPHVLFGQSAWQCDKDNVKVQVILKWLLSPHLSCPPPNPQRSPAEMHSDLLLQGCSGSCWVWKTFLAPVKSSTPSDRKTLCEVQQGKHRHGCGSSQLTVLHSLCRNQCLPWQVTPTYPRWCCWIPRFLLPLYDLHNVDFLTFSHCCGSTWMRNGASISTYSGLKLADVYTWLSKIHHPSEIIFCTIFFTSYSTVPANSSICCTDK